METIPKRLRGTYDVFLASYLITHGFKLVKVEKTAPYHVDMWFELSPELDQAIEDYFGKIDNTHALNFAENYRSLKARLQSLKFGLEGGDRHE
jgi:hypothetical protein